MIKTLLPFALWLLASATALATPTAMLNVDVVPTPPPGTVSQTLLPMTQTTGGNAGIVLQFLAGSGSAGNFVGNPAPAAIMPAAPAFVGTYSLGGADAGKFAIDSSTGLVSVGAANLIAGTYNISTCMTQSGVVGSPACTAWVLQGVDIGDTSTFFMQVSDYKPAPGGAINVTVRNAPNASGGDYVFIQRNYNDLGYTNGYPGTAPYSVFVGSPGTHNAVLSVPVPNPPTDWYQFLTVKYVPNNGVGSQATAITSDLLVQPSIPYVPSTATNTLAAPFTPEKTFTVCPSGCQYASLSQAIIGMSNNYAANGVTDNTLITIQAGAYEDCIQFGNVSPFTAPTNNRVWNLPQHLWVKGVGGGFAHISAMDNSAYVCEGKGIIVFWGNTNDVLYLDNMELSDWVDEAPSGAIYNGTGSEVLRNDYIHDGAMGIITANYGVFTFDIENSQFKRGGGPNGPTHNIYIGQEQSATFDHSISQQAVNGHALKCRAYTCTVTCSEFSESQDPYYVGSEDIDFAQGTQSTPNVSLYMSNNTLVAGGLDSSIHQNTLGIAMDDEGDPPALIAALSLVSNTFIYDGSGQYWHVYLGPTYGTNLLSPSPQTWSTNWFVGSNSASDPYEVYPYYSYYDPSPRGGAGYPSTSQITESGDVQYATRAAANLQASGIPYPMGCTGTIGNLAVP